MTDKGTVEIQSGLLTRLVNGEVPYRDPLEYRLTRSKGDTPCLNSGKLTGSLELPYPVLDLLNA